MSMNSTIKKIVNFILDRPGYLKEGGTRLSRKFGCSKEEAREAVRIAKEEMKDRTADYVDAVGSERTEYSTSNDLELKSTWQAPDGTWLYSYRKGSESPISESKIKGVIEGALSGTTPTYTKGKGEKLDPKNKDRGLFIWTSDKHIGASVDSSIYDNDYGEEEFRSRIEKVLSKCIEMRDLFGKFDTLFLADLGDPLDGMNGTTVRGGHELDQDLSNEEQARVYIESHKKIIDEIVKNDIADSYIIWNVCNDNHSGSFGYVANLALREYVNIAYPDIEFYNQTKFIEYTSYGVHDIILSHGKDTEDRKKGLPLDLDDRTEKFISEYIDYHGLSGKRKHFIKGDLHRSSENITNKFRYKNCPSIFGASKWIHNNFGRGRPSCDIEVFSKDDPEVFKTSIDLG